MEKRISVDLDRPSDHCCRGLTLGRHHRAHHQAAMSPEDCSCRQFSPDATAKPGGRPALLAGLHRPDVAACWLIGRAEGQRYLLLLRFALINMAGLALLGAAAMQGWIGTILAVDDTHICKLLFVPVHRWPGLDGAACRPCCRASSTRSMPAIGRAGPAGRDVHARHPRPRRLDPCGTGHGAAPEAGASDRPGAADGRLAGADRA